MKKEPKFLNVMRISAFLLFLCVFSSFAAKTSSQNARVNISGKNLTIGEFIDQVEKQTDYLFVYSKNEVNTNDAISVKSGNKTVAQYLSEAFGDSNVKYAFDDVPFSYIIKKLELYYDITIIQKNKKLDQYRFSGKFRQRDGVESVLQTLQKVYYFSFVKDEENNCITIR